MSTTPDSLLEGEASALPLSDSAPPAVDGTPPADQLPEYEPLSPELVEDEAVRGDFVIRWATVLLAFLFGWTQIDDTSLLVRIRNGQQHLLPFGNDTFSASAGDRSWVNLAWLFDPILAGLYQVLGASGLTVFGAFVSGATFWVLSRTSVKGVSTWWGSVCAALTLIGVFPQLIPGPTGLSLLGVALVALHLHQWSEDRTAGFRWQLPATIWLWSQLDSRAWLGIAIVLMYALSWIGLRGVEETDAPDRVKTLWKLTGVCLIAWLIHPMHYHVLLSPLTAYQTEYAELRAYKVFDWPFAWQWFPIYSEEFQDHLDFFSIVGVSLCGMALLTFALNYKRLTWEWLLPWVGVVALAVFCAHQLPVAALLSCALMTINAQLWYRGTFSQKYTTDSLPLAWNRGGRAITVVGLLLLGLVGSNGMLMGRDGRRIGSGFSPQLKASIEGAQKLQQEVASPEVFNFRLDQGDLLIWAGLKPYADRRVTLFANGGVNLLEKHRELREATLLPNPKLPKRGHPEIWKAEFDRLHINQAIPRLSGLSPHYLTLIEMLSQGWALTSLQSFGAVLSRTDSPDAAFQKYRQDHPDVSFIKQSFRTAAPKTPTTDGPWAFPRRLTVYDTYLWQPQTTLNEPLQLASHEQELVQLFALSLNQGDQTQMLLTTTGLALSAHRHARQGIVIDPQSAKGYRTLAQASHFLYQIDQMLSRNFQTQYPSQLWLYQCLLAYQHAVLLDPTDAKTHEDLASLLLQMGKKDLASEHFTQVFRLTGNYTSTPAGDPRFENISKDCQTRLKTLRLEVKQATEAALKAEVDTGKWQQSLQAALQGQCPGLALSYLEKNRTDVAQNPEMQLLQIGLLIDAGRTDDALQQAASFNSQLPKSGAEAAQPLVGEGRRLYALSCLAIGDNAQFESIMNEDSGVISDMALRGALEQLPFSTMASIQLDLLPATQGVTAVQTLFMSPERWASNELMLAQSELSTWHNEAATKRLKAILESEPNVSLRPLIAYYLELLTDEPQQALSPERQSMMERAAAGEAAASPATTPAADAPAAGPTEGTPVTAPPATPEPATNPAPEAPAATPPVTPPAAATPAPESPATPEVKPADPPASPPTPTAPESAPAEDKKPE